MFVHGAAYLQRIEVVEEPIVTVTATVDGGALERDVTVGLTAEGSGTEGEAGHDKTYELELRIPAGSLSGTRTFFAGARDGAGIDHVDGTLTVSGRAEGLTVRPATLTLRDDDGTGSAPATVTIWTDATGYQTGRPVRLHTTIEPAGEGQESVVRYYRENRGTGERTYLEPGGGAAPGREAAVGREGEGAGAFRPRRMERAERELIWEDPAPEPGLWQFVAELRRPEATQAPQRAYAKFVVSGKPPAVLGETGRQWRSRGTRPGAATRCTSCGTRCTSNPGRRCGSRRGH